MPQDLSFHDGFKEMFKAITEFIRGNDEQVRLALVCLFAGGHLLIEGVPGVAKTSLAKAMARSVDGADQKRIQFTPDLLPSDVTGAMVFHQKTGDFEFKQGPVFTNILLADEINRASPRTQSALLEVMAEGQVTPDGTPRNVPSPFMCIATQNPVEHRGTFPLPEAQIDRFMMKVKMEPPGTDDELLVLNDGLQRLTAQTVESKLSIEQVKGMICEVKDIVVVDDVQRYIVRIAAETRIPSTDLQSGVSPRATIALGRAAQAFAASHDRHYVSPDDVKAVALPVLRHRLVLRRGALDQKITPDDVINDLLNAVRTPKMAKAARRP